MLNVKTSCKSMITTKEALLRFTVVSFSGKLIFSGVLRHFYASFTIAIIKTLRRLDTTWNFARSIIRVSTHEHEHWAPNRKERMVDLLPVRSHSGINTCCLPWQRRAEEATANVSCSKTVFLVKSVYTNKVLNTRVHVQRPWWHYEQSFMFHWTFLVFLK